MKKNEWIDWDGAAGTPALRVGDMVRVQYTSGRTETGQAYAPANVDWALVKRYLIVPEAREAQLERWYGDACNELASLNADNTALRSQVAALEHMVDQIGNTNRELAAERDELAECVTNMCGEIHTMTVAHMNTLTGLHAGIMCGIERGDLPADFYGRFSTTWAPKK